MSSPRAVREALSALGIRPRKRWGQHFLIDANTVERLVTTADLAPQDAVLEIGPGLGVLTERVAEIAQRVVAVEIDPILSAWLTERFSSAPMVRIVPGDALELDWADCMPTGARWVALGNLPYNITSPLLDRLIAHRNRIAKAVWMTQREVAQKLLAAPGTRETSALGVLVQSFCSVERAFPVSKNAFYPPPDVESLVLEITPRATPVFAAPEPAFRRAIKAAFGVRRKTLRRALSIGLNISVDRAGAILHTASVDPQRRGETLTLEEFDQVAQAMGHVLGIGDPSYGGDDRHSS